MHKYIYSKTISIIFCVKIIENCIVRKLSPYGRPSVDLRYYSGYKTLQSTV